jgi:hypothetical protein
MLNKYVIVLLVTFCACTSFAEKNNDIPIVTNQSDLDLFIGKVITIRGKVTNTKIPTIIGVDVRSEDPDLRGFIAEATGILNKWTVTKNELEKTINEKGMIPNRGPGTFYRLKEVDLNLAAQVRR